MFCRVHLKADDAKKHSFLWQASGGLDIRVIQMDQLTFGDGPSPCDAIAPLHKTAEDFGWDKLEAKESILNGFFLDNLADYSCNICDANPKSKDLIEILAKGTFKLGNYQANHPEFDPGTSTGMCASVLGLHRDSSAIVLSVKTGLVEESLS